ncbi:hypothetical protein SO802_010290 [Lithocarpus litseifolius]|uniref:CASP-like protein n=1 Tax=Lithocarpus litseifolius TaxID=425828 RepID=A0AAW2DGG0_9ROSI
MNALFRSYAPVFPALKDRLSWPDPKETRKVVLNPRLIREKGRSVSTRIRNEMDKGRKRSRAIPWKEGGRKVQCRLCDQERHNRRTCPKRNEIVILSLRRLSLLFLLLSLIIVIINTKTQVSGPDGIIVILNKLHSYRYNDVLQYSSLNVTYNLVISYLLATAAGAGIGASIDFKDLVDGKFSMSYYNDEFVSAGKLSTSYYNNGLVSAGFLLLAFVCTSSLSIMSSYALQKKV